MYFAFASVLKETLENRGVLGQIRARVRAEVFGALDDQVSDKFIICMLYVVFISLNTRSLMTFME